jgi:iron complex outermembrane receptor protein
LEWRGKGRFRGEASFYYNYIRDFIYLAPALPPTLTIRGAFPTFNYRQTDASFKGADLSLRFGLGYGISYAAKGSFLRAYNESAGEYLILIPADRMENGLEWDHPEWKKLRDLHVGISVQSVFKQTHSAPDSQDYSPPPAGYALIHARLGFSLPLKNSSVNLDLEASNLLDARYRDYSNRFRYFADDTGRNIALRLKVPFEIPR